MKTVDALLRLPRPEPTGSSTLITVSATLPIRLCRNDRSQQGENDRPDCAAATLYHQDAFSILTRDSSMTASYPSNRATTAP